MKDPLRYHVYAYVCPTTFQIRYIGKGTRDRPSVHWTRATHGRPVQNVIFGAWLVGLHEKQLKPIILKLADRLTEHEALLLEAQLILKNGIHGKDPKGKLLNRKRGELVLPKNRRSEI